MKTTLKILLASFLTTICLLGLEQCKNGLTISKTIDGGTVKFTMLPVSKGEYHDSVPNSPRINELVKPFNFSSDDIVSIKGKVTSIELIDSTIKPITFDIFDKASVYTYVPGIPVTRIAFKDPIPHDGSKAIGPDTDPDMDWTKIIHQDPMTVHLRMTLNSALDHKVYVLVKLQYEVKMSKK